MMEISEETFNALVQRDKILRMFESGLNLDKTCEILNISNFWKDFAPAVERMSRELTWERQERIELQKKLTTAFKMGDVLDRTAAFFAMEIGYGIVPEEDISEYTYYYWMDDDHIVRRGKHGEKPLPAPCGLGGEDKWRGWGLYVDGPSNTWIVVHVPSE